MVDPSVEHDPTAIDVLLPQPVYAGQYWVCVLNPRQSWRVVPDLLDQAYAFAVRKYEKAAKRRGPRE